MNFIESLLGISPDANSGALETLLFAIPFIIILALAANPLRQGRGSEVVHRPEADEAFQHDATAS